MKTALVLITCFVLIQVRLDTVRGQYPFEDPNGSLHELVLDPNCKTIQLFRA